jgi:hypothetical protein
MRAAIKRLADIVLVAFGVLLLVLLFSVVFYFRPTIEMAGSGGIGAVSVGGSLLLSVGVLIVGIVGVSRLLYLVGRALLHAARPMLQRSGEHQHDEPRRN